MHAYRVALLEGSIFSSCLRGSGCLCAFLGLKVYIALNLKAIEKEGDLTHLFRAMRMNKQPSWQLEGGGCRQQPRISIRQQYFHESLTRIDTPAGIILELTQRLWAQGQNPAPPRT